MAGAAATGQGEGGVQACVSIRSAGAAQDGATACKLSPFSERNALELQVPDDAGRYILQLVFARQVGSAAYPFPGCEQPASFTLEVLPFSLTAVMAMSRDYHLHTPRVLAGDTLLSKVEWLTQHEAWRLLVRSSENARGELFVMRLHSRMRICSRNFGTQLLPPLLYLLGRTYALEGYCAELLEVQCTFLEEEPEQVCILLASPAPLLAMPAVLLPPLLRATAVLAQELLLS